MIYDIDYFNLKIMQPEDLTTHFINAFQPQIQSARSALANFDMEKLRQVVDSIKNSGPVQSLTAKISSSREAFVDFYESQLAKLGGVGDFLAACFAMGIGIGCMLEAPAIALALGLASVSLVYIVGMALLLLGVCKMYKINLDRVDEVVKSALNP